jgi:hypothetical protein
MKMLTLNGKLDPNENDGAATAPDDNADGILWPGNVITVSCRHRDHQRERLC